MSGRPALGPSRPDSRSGPLQIWNEPNLVQFEQPITVRRNFVYHNLHCVVLIWRKNVDFGIYWWRGQGLAYRSETSRTCSSVNKQSQLVKHILYHNLLCIMQLITKVCCINMEKNVDFGIYWYWDWGLIWCQNVVFRSYYHPWIYSSTHT